MYRGRATLFVCVAPSASHIPLVFVDGIEIVGSRDRGSVESHPGAGLILQALYRRSLETCSGRNKCGSSVALCGLRSGSAMR